MSTLADIRKIVDPGTTMWAGTDNTTPAGTFVVVVKTLGETRTYLLAGTPDQEDAPILGHVNLTAHVFHIGSGLYGGTFGGFLRPDEASTDAFAQIVERSANR